MAALVQPEYKGPWQGHGVGKGAGGTSVSVIAMRGYCCPFHLRAAVLYPHAMRGPPFATGCPLARGAVRRWRMHASSHADESRRSGWGGVNARNNGQRTRLLAQQAALRFRESVPSSCLPYSASLKRCALGKVVVL